MELKPGRRVHAAVPPEDWKPKPIRNFSAFVTKGATPTTYGFTWENDGVVFLRSECVSDHGLDLAQAMFISSKAHAALGRGEVRPGDILMTITGNVGRVVRLTPDFAYANINQHIARIRINDAEVDPGFVFHFLSQPNIRAHYVSITTGQAYPQISLTQVRETQIPLPLPTEQRSIAEALGDVDALLGALTQLIAKKRNLKQGAMQQLLTGQTRLPGFSGEWEVSTVGREFDIQLGKMLDADRNRGIPKPYIGNKAVQWNSIEIDDLPMVPMSRSDLDRFRLLSGDLLVCEGGEVGRAAIWEGPIDECYYQKALHRLRPLRGFNPRLMVELLRHWAEAGLLANYVTQTSIAHLTREKLAEVTMPVPPPDEQRAIASVLSDMDANITALEQRLAKTRALKQGMMQELLTGRTRLV